MGLDIDDGAQFVFAKQGVVLLFATAHEDESLGHCQKGVHGGGVTVELVEEDIAGVHEVLIGCEGDVLGTNDLHLGGVALLENLQGAEHDVGAFVLGTRSLDADEETDTGVVGMWLLGLHRSEVDGEGDEVEFVGEARLAANVVFVESGDDAVAVLRHCLEEGGFVAMEPVGLHLVGEGIVAPLPIDIEIAVAEGCGFDALLDPGAVDAEGAEEEAAVLAAQALVVGEDAMGAQVEKDGVDELDNVVALQRTHRVLDVEEIFGGVEPTCGLALEVDVARVALPAVAVGNDSDLVAQCAESLGEGPVDIAVFAYEKYLHDAKVRLN